MIEIENFTKKYFFSKKIAVENFSLVCQKNQCTALLGVNGAGKTTILKAVCARHFATSGKIFVSSIDCKKNPQKIKKIVAFVEESNENFSLPYTVKEFLIFRTSLFGFSGKNLENHIQNAIEFCSLKEVLNEKISTLSGGFKKRLSFANALIFDPQILVLDEPMNALDPVQIVKMREIIKNLATKKTVLISTHLISEASNLAQKICIISNGKNVASGTESEILKFSGEESLEKAFLKFSLNPKKND